MSLLHQIYENKYIFDSYNIEGLIDYYQISRTAATLFITFKEELVFDFIEHCLNYASPLTGK